MPEPAIERPSDIRSREDFARLLSALRDRAGLTVRQVAARAGSAGAHSTIGDWFAGRGLPSLALRELFVRVLKVCGVDDAELVEEWLSAWQRVRRAPGRRAGGPEPYRGLAGFREEHAGWFFGRETLTARLLARVAELDGGGVQLVVGASGSGKSSLLRAGLIPALKAKGRSVTLLTPSVAPAPEPRGGQGLVLVVDQFEEVFTVFADEERRAAFIAALLGAASDGAVVVAGLRADFYAHVLRRPDLVRAVQEGPLAVGPLSGEELRQVIVEPARKARIDVEDGLVELLVREAARAHDAGVLPLLSHALYATWLHGQGRRLTVAGYREVGGIEGAIAASAGDVYDELDDRQRELARRLFLHLVHVAPDTADTRRRVTRAELLAAESGDGEREMEDVLGRFVAQRLITVDGDTVEITHEALLWAWPLLRGWIDAGRVGLLVGRRVLADAEAWRADHRDPDALYRGARLLAAQEWAQAHGAGVPPTVREFLQAGAAQARRRVRRLYQAVTALAVVSALALIASGVAVQAQRTAVRQRDEALSRKVAAETAALRRADPALAVQLSVAAHRLAPTVEARGAVLSLSAEPYATRVTGHTGAVYATAFAPGGGLMATAGDEGVVRLWDTADPHRPRPLAAVPAHEGGALTAAFDPGGRTLATAGVDQVIRLWDVTDPRRPAPLGVLRGHAGTVRHVAFRADGRVLASASYDRTARLWDVADPRAPRPLAVGRGSGDGLSAVAFSPDGRTLVTTAADRVTRVWDVADPRRPRAAATLGGHTAPVLSAAFSPDGRVFATGAFDNTIRLWDAGTRKTLAVLEGHANGVVALAFSPDGRTLASGGYDLTTRLWDLSVPAAGRVPLTLDGHGDIVYAVAFSPDGRTLASGSKDTTARLWDLSAPVPAGHTGRVYGAAFAPGGDLLVTGTADGARLWRANARREPPVPLAGHTDYVVATAFHPRGRLLATGSLDYTTRLWDLSSPAEPVAVLRGHGDNVLAVAFDPASTLLATGGADRLIKLWDVRDPRRPVAVATLTGHTASVSSLVFGPDGRTLASASLDGTARLWNVPDARRVSVAATVRGHSGGLYAVARHGRVLATAGADGAVRLWDTSVPARPAPLATLTGHTTTVSGLAFSPDGRTLASGGFDKTVRLWDVSAPGRPAPLGTLTGHSERVESVAFSPDGAVLVSGGADGTARLWPLDVDTVSRALCAMAHPPITAEQWRTYLPGIPFTPPCG
ncbi:WD40 repeat protein/transcriptional regulator with XRE-family HTH domain [Thermocatellispora tengchongensis]|uniref:WD40 repeat protein/transcriptional regulator with XRE-family HTH domain n=1 Tax=Thermocatellispora tengchongensis TaxID=1073253 RepID=A0A840PEJ4_9ACTN|nr:helix-turn-helix domain-containing protein [Thermocatellispora tengchongensis]MBB5137176.1 WD40 repeat protein/transcriptional regulator with XRE-family HTH domain [Thermocatellispora tengchongensis]